MYHHLIQFETRRAELEAQLRLAGEREALARAGAGAGAADAHDRIDPSPSGGLATRLRPFGPGRSSLARKRAELRRVPLFEALPRRRFDLLAQHAEILAVPAGRELIREGATGREFFAISAGEVRISKGGRNIAIEKAGGVFGEIALLQGVPRTATVTTTAPSRLFVLTAQVFHSVVAPLFVSSRRAAP